jgi:hypothetical protein
MLVCNYFAECNETNTIQQQDRGAFTAPGKVKAENLKEKVKNETPPGSKKIDFYFRATFVIRGVNLTHLSISLLFYLFIFNISVLYLWHE